MSKVMQLGSVTPGMTVQFQGSEATFVAVKSWYGMYVCLLVRTNDLSPYIVCKMNPRAVENNEWDSRYFSGLEGAFDAYSRY
jgi:hypothetical protein